MSIKRPIGRVRSCSGLLVEQRLGRTNDGKVTEVPMEQLGAKANAAKDALDVASGGKDDPALVRSIRGNVDSALAKFEAAIRTFPEVVDCWLMTGNRDYLLRISTRGLAEFERFLVGRFTKVPGVASIESSIPLRRVKTGLARIS
jgi:DNA-binding Lrp family transcriptional regulator